MATLTRAAAPMPMGKMVVRAVAEMTWAMTLMKMPREQRTGPSSRRPSP